MSPTPHGTKNQKLHPQPLRVPKIKTQAHPAPSNPQKQILKVVPDPILESGKRRPL